MNTFKYTIREGSSAAVNQGSSSKLRDPDEHLSRPVQQLREKIQRGNWKGITPIVVSGDGEVRVTYQGFEGSTSTPAEVLYIVSSDENQPADQGSMSSGGEDVAATGHFSLQQTDDLNAALALTALAFIQARCFEGLAQRVSVLGGEILSAKRTSIKDANEDDKSRDQKANDKALIDEETLFLDAALEASTRLWFNIGSPDKELQGVYLQAQEAFGSKIWRKQLIEDVQLLRTFRESEANKQEREQANRLNAILLALTVITIVTGIAAIWVAILVVTTEGLPIAWAVLALTSLLSILVILFRWDLMRLLRREESPEP